MSIWYPSWEFYLETHEIMLKKFGGHPGVKRAGQAIFNDIMEDVGKTDIDIFVKAGIMLKKLRTLRIVEDAQKRTAYTVTATFLEMNGEKICVTDPEKASNFVKDILKYSLKDVIEWIKNGKVPKES